MLKLDEIVNPQLIEECLDLLGADSWYPQHLDEACGDFAFEVVVERQPAGDDQSADFFLERLADAANLCEFSRGY